MFEYKLSLKYQVGKNRIKFNPFKRFPSIKRFHLEKRITTLEVQAVPPLSRKSGKLVKVHTTTQTTRCMLFLRKYTAVALYFNLPITYLAKRIKIALRNRNKAEILFESHMLIRVVLEKQINLFISKKEANFSIRNQHASILNPLPYTSNKF